MLLVKKYRATRINGLLTVSAEGGVASVLLRDARAVQLGELSQGPGGASEGENGSAGGGAVLVGWHLRDGIGIICTDCLRCCRGIHIVHVETGQCGVDGGGGHERESAGGAIRTEILCMKYGKISACIFQLKNFSSQVYKIICQCMTKNPFAV